jgi:hypothetical protein
MKRLFGFVMLCGCCGILFAQTGPTGNKPVSSSASSDKDRFVPSFVRVYGDSGYIVNKTTFSDRVTDISGAVFLSALSREPRTLDEMPGLSRKNS